MKVSVAYIKKPRGFKGELAVIPYRVNTQSLQPGLEITLQKGIQSRIFSIESVKILRDRIAVKLIGIDDENSAVAWCGGDILIDLDKLATLGKGEYYNFQIEGANVYEEAGKFVGKVSEVNNLAANDVLTVIGDQGEILIPFIKQVIVSVDVENKEIVIRKMEGLY
jgi:16S rRNA processing protein RimM